MTAGRSGPLYAYKQSAAAPLGSGPGGFFVGFAIAGGSLSPANGALGTPWRGNCFFAARAQWHRALLGTVNRAGATMRSHDCCAV